VGCGCGLNHPTSLVSEKNEGAKEYEGISGVTMRAEEAPLKVGVGQVLPGCLCVALKAMVHCFLQSFSYLEDLRGHSLATALDSAVLQIHDKGPWTPGLRTWVTTVSRGQ
jgi:hypothetical protein